MITTKLKQLLIFAVCFTFVFHTTSNTPTQAVSTEHEYKTQFQTHEKEKAQEYSNDKKNQWIQSLINIHDKNLATNFLKNIDQTNKKILEQKYDPFFQNPKEFNLLNKLIKTPNNKIPTAKTMYSQFSLEQLGLTQEYLTENQKNHTQKEQNHVHETFIKQFTETKSTDFANIIFMENFLKLKLTPEKPKNTPQDNKLTVELTIPVNSYIAYTGNNEAILPKDTFIQYKLDSLRINPTNNTYTIKANVIKTDTKEEIENLHNKHENILTNKALENGIITTEQAKKNPIKLNTSGFKKPIVIEQAYKLFTQLNNNEEYPKAKIIRKLIKNAIDKGGTFNLTGETIGENIIAYTQNTHVTIDLLYPSFFTKDNPHHSIGTLAHETMHLFENLNHTELQKTKLTADRISYELRNTLKNKNNENSKNEIDNLIEHNNIFGSYWQSGFEYSTTEQKWIRLKMTSFAETFAEFGRWILSDNEETNDLLKQLAPTSYKYVNQQINKFLQTTS